MIIKATPELIFYMSEMAFLYAVLSRDSKQIKKTQILRMNAINKLSKQK